MIFSRELFFYPSKNELFIYTQLFENLKGRILKSITSGVKWGNKPPSRKRSIVRVKSVNAGRDMCFGKLHLLIHVKIHMTHATDLELNTRAFAPPFAHINIHSSWKNKGIGGGGGEDVPTFRFKSALAGSSAVPFKKVPLTTDLKISLRARFCSPAAHILDQFHDGRFTRKYSLVNLSLQIFTLKFSLIN